MYQKDYRGGTQARFQLHTCPVAHTALRQIRVGPRTYPLAERYSIHAFDVERGVGRIHPRTYIDEAVPLEVDFFSAAHTSLRLYAPLTLFRL